VWLVTFDEGTRGGNTIHMLRDSFWSESVQHRSYWTRGSDGHRQRLIQVVWSSGEIISVGGFAVNEWEHLVPCARCNDSTPLHSAKCAAHDSHPWSTRQRTQAAAPSVITRAPLRPARVDAGVESTREAATRTCRYHLRYLAQVASG
jgi:hypothetical protein